jgi:hypothetical protein
MPYVLRYFAARGVWWKTQFTMPLFPDPPCKGQWRVQGGFLTVKETMNGGIQLPKRRRSERPYVVRQHVASPLMPYTYYATSLQEGFGGKRQFTMALLNGGVDTDIIRLIGRWRSDKMLRYLHVQAEPLMQCHSALMLAGGNYTLHPNSAVPLY